MTHICVSKLPIVGSDNGLSPGRRQVIIWTNSGILLTWALGTNFTEILIEMQIFSLKKMHWKMSSGKWQPFCLGPNVSRWSLPWNDKKSIAILGIDPVILSGRLPRGPSVCKIIIYHLMMTLTEAYYKDIVASQPRPCYRRTSWYVSVPHSHTYLSYSHFCCSFLTSVFSKNICD